MSHVATNNEIIRMRPVVRKARVGVVWKLTKEAKLLKNRKHGDEKTLTKCKRKAEKLVREIKAVKRIREDDIAKFAILNGRSLQEVLADPTVDVVTRVMTRVAFHKLLRGAVEKFHEKFPNYKLGKKQMKKGELKKCLGITTSSASEKENSQVKGRKSPMKKVKRTGANSTEMGGTEGDASDAENSSKIDECDVEDSWKVDDIEDEILPSQISEAFDDENEKLEAVKVNKRKMNEENSAKMAKSTEKSSKKLKKTVENLGNHEKSAKSKAKATKIDENSSKWSKTLNPKNSQQNLETSESSEFTEQPRKIKIVSKLATVKRLKVGESLEESDEPSETVDEATRQSEKLDLSTEVDSFFISGTSGDAFKTVVLPKFTPSAEDDENYEKNAKFTSKFERSKNLNFSSKREFSKNSHFSRDSSKNSRFSRDLSKNANFSSNREFSKNSNFPSKFEHPQNFNQNGAKSGRKNFENSTKSRKNFGAKFEDDKFAQNARDKIEETVDLHPSWAARRKQQEAMKIGFQGKKIVFDDN